MSWIVCDYSKAKIDAAGKSLVTLSPHDPARENALEVINNWRSCHSYPLHIVTKTLRDRAKRKVNVTALVARRIKRLSSIALKLRHNAEMKLSQMQDIGGCRCVLKNVREVERLVETYALAAAKHPNTTDRPFLHKTYDYISQPKSDGYRGVHLIMKYQSQSKPDFNGQRIEIQVRSQLQHAWATAVETCQTFTGQAIKSKIKTASDSWLRFFSLMSTAIAVREKRPGVPGTPTAAGPRVAELKNIEKQEGIINLLQGWSSAIQHPSIADDHESAAYLLTLDIQSKRLVVRSFKVDELTEAYADYLRQEKATENDVNIQVVLVSADSLASLRRAYPNFYVDTTAFISAVKQEIR